MLETSGPENRWGEEQERVCSTGIKLRWGVSKNYVGTEKLEFGDLVTNEQN